MTRRRNSSASRHHTAPGNDALGPQPAAGQAGQIVAAGQAGQLAATGQAGQMAVAAQAGQSPTAGQAGQLLVAGQVAQLMAEEKLEVDFVLFVRFASLSAWCCSVAEVIFFGVHVFSIPWDGYFRYFATAAIVCTLLSYSVVHVSRKSTCV